MTKRLLSLPLCAVLVLMLAGPLAAAERQPLLAKAVYLTQTRACACTLERCQAGDAVVAQVFTGKRAAILNRVDLSDPKANGAAWLKEYRVAVSPALLLLDAKGKLLWSAQGVIDRAQLLQKLAYFGG